MSLLKIKSEVTLTITITIYTCICKAFALKYIHYCLSLIHINDTYNIYLCRPVSS